MIYVLLGALTLQSCLFVVLLDRVTTRQATQTANLCQRLQAPDTAVAQHVLGTSTDVHPYLPFDDDGAFLKYATDTYTISDSELG